MNRFLKFFVLFCVVALCTAQFTTDARKRSSRRSSASGVVHKVNAAQFERKVADYNYSPFRLKGNRPVVIDFYATWCGPCRRLAPHMDDLARKYAGKVDFYKVDVDENPEVRLAYGVDRYPTVFIITPSGGYNYFTGLPQEPYSYISKWIDDMIY